METKKIKIIIEVISKFICLIINSLLICVIIIFFYTSYFIINEFVDVEIKSKKIIVPEVVVNKNEKSTDTTYVYKFKKYN